MSVNFFQLFKSKINQPLDDSFPPFTKWLNGTFLSVELEGIRMKFTVREEMLNPVGITHGGILAAMIDEVIGLTVAVQGLENLYLTVNLNVDFLSNVRKGEEIIAQSKLQRKGQNIINVACTLYDTHNNILCKGTSNLVNTGKKFHVKKP